MDHTSQTRCSWANSSELMAQYHDEEWGVPCRDDDRLFEMLTLEGAQAGLSWETVLKKRDGYRQAFHNFHIDRVAAMTSDEIAQILLNPNVIRHRGKLESTVSNAKAAQETQKEFGSLSTFLWSFVKDEPIVSTTGQIPATTPESDAMSKALRKRGFKFVGSTIVYAFMQACGMVDDHVEGCFRRNGR